MLRHVAVPVVLACLLAVPASALDAAPLRWTLLDAHDGSSTSSAPQNDAGTNMDASNVRAAPTMLPDFGTYRGELRSHDQDWYGATNASSASGPLCVVATATGTTYSNVTLGIKQGASDRSVRTLLPESGSTTLAMAGTNVAQSYFGIEPVPNPANNDAARPGDYEFSLRGFRAAELGPGDGGTGNDAGSVLGAAVPLRSVCTAGMLAPLSGFGDTRDVYSFNGTRNATIVYSLGSTSAAMTLSIVDAFGNTVGPAISSGQAASIVLPSDGVYYPQASQSDGNNQLTYVFALLGMEGPPGRPCRPYCVLG